MSQSDVDVAFVETERMNPASSRAVGGPTKRAADVIIASTALFVFSPVMLLIALLIRIGDRGPAIFSQQRIGYGGRTFRCLKFRSMVLNSQEVLQELLANDPDAAREWAETQKLRNDPRITRIGRILRQTSLDELPQLFNVLVGEMSVVGPRPIVQAEAARYGKQFDVYKAAKPGMTGNWQVNGRSDTSYEKRVEYDVAYVQDWSLGRDLAICFKTVDVVLRSKGSY